jgi:hypothetical protein
METTLAPLLQKQDRAAWRTRAFAFAILGREDEAEAIARSTMPTELANGMAPYLRFMRKLTPAQQAAAANLGRFPMPRRSARTIRASPLTPRSMAFAIWPLPMRRWRLPERRSVPRRARRRPRRPGWPLPTSRAAGRVGRRWMPRRRCLLPPPIPCRPSPIPRARSRRRLRSLERRPRAVLPQSHRRLQSRRPRLRPSCRRFPARLPPCPQPRPRPRPLWQRRRRSWPRSRSRIRPPATSIWAVCRPAKARRPPSPARCRPRRV